MLLLGIPPTPALAPWVMGYWFIEDLDGVYAGQPIRTTPHAAAVLTINFGRPCTGEFAVGGPQASLLGIQSQPRSWTSGEGCSFVMVMLRAHGLARLFPRTGLAASDNQLELGSVLGDGVARRLREDLSGAWEPHLVAARLDQWLLHRLAAIRPSTEVERLSRACEALLRTTRVDAAASAAAVSRRQLERWFQSYVGHSPKRLVTLQRIQTSLHAAQTGTGDPLDGYSDQAHRIRSWRQYLGVTPGQYARSAMSPMAAHFTRDPNAAPEGLAHFL
ncbi:helix-turn-helix domain-containing protein [Hyalangium gracile]|uniref:helix-turn-helix domain-containing protein n=1 Tax=Hyalangium gracile TaxID=394092 RepID=UPI001CCA874F|nr:helix-turn-helix domain-containing protein [Hyalangium gracile]